MPSPSWSSLCLSVSGPPSASKNACASAHVSKSEQLRSGLAGAVVGIAVGVGVGVTVSLASAGVGVAVRVDAWPSPAGVGVAVGVAV